MVVKGGRTKKSASLAHGRPPTVQSNSHVTLSSRATRTLIRSHHQLHKSLADAERAGNEADATDLKQRIASQGGLQSYQQASIQGQSKDRGGDTSKVLLEWTNTKPDDNVKTIRMLEIGALSTSNACSKCPLFDVTRIDLHSQAKGIEQQDFMDRPLPTSHQDRFDMISLSLVLNYVPDARGRGAMLARTCQFLRKAISGHAEEATRLPLLFLVLPAPCVTNSRYMNDTRFTAIMESLGFVKTNQRISSKLVYSLWALEDAASSISHDFPKVEVNPGKTRNNFCVILE